MSAFAPRCCGKDTKWPDGSLKVYGSLTKGLMKRALSRCRSGAGHATDGAKRGQRPLFGGAGERFLPRRSLLEDAVAARTKGPDTRLRVSIRGITRWDFRPRERPFCREPSPSSTALYIRSGICGTARRENAIGEPAGIATRIPAAKAAVRVPFHVTPMSSKCGRRIKSPCNRKLCRIVKPRAERWPSGRRRSPAKGVYRERYRGFESLLLRQFPHRKKMLRQEADGRSLSLPLEPAGTTMP